MAKSKAVKPPDHLDDTAKKIFKAVVQQVDASNPVDLNFVAIYAENYCRYIELGKLIKNKGSSYVDGNGVSRRRPEVMERAKAFDTFCKAASMLGIDRRFRATGKIGAKSKEAEDKFAKLTPISRAK